MALNTIMWAGQRGTFIWFNQSTSQWTMRTRTYPAYGTSSVSMTTLLLGMSEWSFENDRDCVYPEGMSSKQLSLTRCEQGQFNCNDGQCIPIAEQCDGNINCNDGSDEMNCSKVYVNATYNHNLGPANIVTEIDVYVNVNSIENIDEENGNFRTGFQLSYCWSDSRVEIMAVHSSAHKSSQVCTEADELSEKESRKTKIHYF